MLKCWELSYEAIGFLGFCLFMVLNNSLVMRLLCPLNTGGFTPASAGTEVQQSTHMPSSKRLGHSLAFASLWLLLGHKNYIIRINEFLQGQIVKALFPLESCSMSILSSVSTII